MNQKKLFLLLILVFLLVLGGAYVLYQQLGDDLAPDQLTVEGGTPPTEEQTPAGDSAGTADDETPGTADGDEGQDTAQLEIIPAPDFTVYDIDGNAVKLSDYFGKPIVLNFWASWCGPCKSEMPTFDGAYAELGQQVQFLMINSTDGARETLDTASAYVTDNGFSFPVFYDTQQDASIQYSVYALPTTYFIDAEGNIVARAIRALDRDMLQRGIDMIYQP